MKFSNKVQLNYQGCSVFSPMMAAIAGPAAQSTLSVDTGAGDWLHSDSKCYQPTRRWHMLTRSMMGASRLRQVSLYIDGVFQTAISQPQTCAPHH